jgi:hypothetical protein
MVKAAITLTRPKAAIQSVESIDRRRAERANPTRNARNDAAHSPQITLAAKCENTTLAGSGAGGAS